MKSSVTIDQNIDLTVTTNDVTDDEEIKARISTILAELLTVRKGRKLYELNLSDINHSIRSNYSASTNVEITTPAADVKLEKDKVITLGTVTVTIRRE